MENVSVIEEIEAEVFEEISLEDLNDAIEREIGIIAGRRVSREFAEAAGLFYVEQENTEA